MNSQTEKQHSIIQSIVLYYILLYYCRSTDMSAQYYQCQDDLRKHDILCTKDRTVCSHPGNRLFRSKIDGMTEAYERAGSALQKTDITRRIIQELKQKHGCRFLGYDKKTESWTEISPRLVRDKVSHALRFAIRQIQNKKNKQAAVVAGELETNGRTSRESQRVHTEHKSTMDDSQYQSSSLRSRDCDETGPWFCSMEQREDERAVRRSADCKFPDPGYNMAEHYEPSSRRWKHHQDRNGFYASHNQSYPHDDCCGSRTPRQQGDHDHTPTITREPFFDRHDLTSAVSFGEVSLGDRSMGEESSRSRHSHRRRISSTSSLKMVSENEEEDDHVFRRSISSSSKEFHHDHSVDD